MFRIRIHLMRIRIRIQHFRLNTDPDPDSEYGSGSTDLLESVSNTDPVRNTGKVKRAMKIRPLKKHTISWI
jgi:hypothetical protein